MDDRITIEIVEVGEDSHFEFGLGRDTDVSEHGARHLGEEAFDEIEPRTVFRREHEAETPLPLGGDPGLGLFGYMCGVIVEDQLDCGIRRIGGIKPLEEANELTRPMAILDASMHFACEQIDPGEQAQRAVALVFVVASEARVRPRMRRKVGGVLPIA